MTLTDILSALFALYIAGFLSGATLGYFARVLDFFSI